MTTEKKPERIDISKLGTKTAADKGAEMTLLEPFQGQPTGAVFNVLGYESETIRAASKEFSRMATRNSKKNTNPDEVLAERRIYLAERAIVGGRDFVWNGKEVLVPSDEFREILRNPDFDWISSQVERFGTARGNYTPEGLHEPRSGQSTSGS